MITSHLDLLHLLMIYPYTCDKGRGATLTKYTTYQAASPQAKDKLPSAIDLESGFIIGGTSAGANFIAGIAHIIAQETDPSLKLSYRLTGILFLAGTICHEDARPEKYRDRILSIDEITESAGLTKEGIIYFAGKALVLFSIYFALVCKGSIYCRYY